jgi:hypothetical protein
MHLYVPILAIVLPFFLGVAHAVNTPPAVAADHQEEGATSLLRGSSKDGKHGRELGVSGTGTSSIESCAYYYYKRTCAKRNFLGWCVKHTDYAWYNGYMYCMDREGINKDWEFPGEYGSGLHLLDRSGDYLVYKGDCNKQGCKYRTDIGDKSCTKSSRLDFDPLWYNYQC